MTIEELITELQRFDSDQPVRIAHQENWPLRETIRSVTVLEDVLAPEDEEEEDLTADGEIVFIVAGGHPYDESPYASKALWEAG